MAIRSCAVLWFGLSCSALAASSLTASLESKAKVAFADIAKAKTALDAGNSKASQTWLGKAEGLLGSVLNLAPGSGLLGIVDQASGAAQQGDAQQSANAVSSAESEAAKLDPALAAKLGIAKDKATQGDASGASGALAEARMRMLT